MSCAASTNSGLSPGRSISVCVSRGEVLLSVVAWAAEVVDQALHERATEHADRARRKGVGNRPKISSIGAILDAVHGSAVNLHHGSVMSWKPRPA